MERALKKLEEQVIVITGATSGIGLATARMAASRGASVVAVARNEQALRRLVEELQASGAAAAAICADVSKEEEVERAAKGAIEAFGHFDTWINNAGVTIFGEALAVGTRDMQRVMETNYWGTVFGSRAAVRHFIEQKRAGALINVGSFFGDKGVVLQSAYAAAKFAVHGWTESLRMELEKKKVPVSVTLIHPGRVNTPFTEHAKSYLKRQPAHIGMIYPPSAVAEAILYAAEHPKRDFYVGSQARLGVLFSRIAPRTADRLFEAVMYRTQQSERPSRALNDNALYQPGYGLHEQGEHIGWFRSGSLYVKAVKHRKFSAAAAAGIGAVLLYSIKKRNSKGAPRKVGFH